MPEITYRKPPEDPDEVNLHTLKQIAKAAGHGHTHKPLAEGLPSQMSPCWFSLEDNCRATYDVRFVQTFNPDFVHSLLERLERAEAQKPTTTSPDTARLEAARAQLPARRSTAEAAVDDVAEKVDDAAAFVLLAAQRDVAWVCDLGHEHPRPSPMMLRPLAEQAEALRARILDGDCETYSGSIWHLAVRRLAGHGLLSDYGIDFEFDITDKGVIQ